jgi:hypothetical protein
VKSLHNAMVLAEGEVAKSRVAVVKPADKSTNVARPAAVKILDRDFSRSEIFLGRTNSDR